MSDANDAPVGGLDLERLLGVELASELAAVARFLTDVGGEPVQPVELVRVAVHDFCALARLTLPAG